MPQPFEASPEELEQNIDIFVDSVYADLQSSFLVLPKGSAFVEYPRFQEAYERLKQATRNFSDFSPNAVWNAMLGDSLTLLVVRTMLGFTPPEWAELTRTELGVQVDQGAARSLDQRVRLQPDYIARLAANKRSVTIERVRGMVELACRLIGSGAPPGAANTVHRLDKVDTTEGLLSARRAAAMGIPYAMLLYERYLGRPFASHRDAVSELVGDVMESAIEDQLSTARITYRATRRAERIPGFEQAPDFIVPDELTPQVVLEAKITNDDGTARDKIARLLRLAQLSDERLARGEPGFEVVACIDGRGFGIRREDMRLLLRRLHGKVFTLKTLGRLIEHSRLHEFRYA